jgi:hypothetical protein
MAVTLYGSGNAIVQVKQYGFNNPEAFTNNNWQNTSIDTRNSPFIRTSNSNKILIFADIKGSTVEGGGDTFYRIVRNDDTVICPGDGSATGQGWQTSAQNDAFHSVSLGMRFMDTSLPNGSTFYTIQVYAPQTGIVNARAYYLGINGNVSFPVSSQITLMEVAFV